MTEGRGDGGQSKGKLLSAGMLEKLKNQRSAGPVRRNAANPPNTSPQAVRKQKRFEELDSYKTVQVQKAVAAFAGVENPFYRPHETVAGAETMIEGRKLLNFASYDYLATNADTRVHEAAKQAIDQYGISASASRLVAGERPVHAELERALAENYGVESAVCFVSGYLTNITAISCVMGPQDVVIHDEFIHNSALTGAQLSGAKRLNFKHNDISDLERVLANINGQFRNVLVIVEGIYSMDGDVADLRGILDLRKKCPFWLMVDEAHSLGVLGKTGKGTFEHLEIDPNEVDIWMGTLSKTSSSCGGYIAGSAALIDILKAHAGGFVYSVGLSPPLAAAALASLRILRESQDRISRLSHNGRFFLQRAKERGLDTGTSAGHSVVPVIVGDSLRAVELSNRLFAEGINALPIIHPAVPERLARIRFFLTCTHTEEQISEAVEKTATLLQKLVAQNVGTSSLDLEALQRSLSLR
ncbi:aminotransferase class I/II-fold pyridoxal phosphate-dependent enzyme [Agrobacterium larrymoorei]|uniref:aminotransferase class I/II-fold pyridoxal phosphate-dependent enzyme n=1 Tax=Agrobacterium larrymoorei TaxID=160699 RepID=UPI00157356E3|nr:aminotransferase class I/II-fold pyridoxal phosphate-dependent enzyme [Agrobacterium larrymoorei]NTJ43586.1 aminotransferase class I/II-fold pyridoxal phosphate-dependent enzyme [Agrobacterium larrymoorei]